MKIAVVGSRTITRDIGPFLPEDATGVVSGGARGVDTQAAAWAKAHGIPLTEILPDYERYGRSAPIRRNVEIINAADVVYCFWDGQSHGTRFVLDRCRKTGKPFRLFLPDGVSSFREVRGDLQ